MKRKTILFATDFTANDQQAFQVACQFSRLWNATLLIVHVNDSDDESETMPPKLTSRSQLFSIYPDDIDVRYEHLLKEGDPAEQIVEVAHSENAMLIVLGTHGRKGFSRIVSGSVAEHVIRDADCPVMTIRESTSLQSDEEKQLRILVPIDFSVYSYAALDFASQMGKSLGAELTILHVDDTTDAAEFARVAGTQEAGLHESKIWKQLKEYVPTDPGIKYSHKLVLGEPDEQIAHYLNSKHYDFIVIGTHGRTGFQRAVMGSVAEKVVRDADCPVITVKPSNKRTPILR